MREDTRYVVTSDVTPLPNEFEIQKLSGVWDTVLFFSLKSYEGAILRSNQGVSQDMTNVVQQGDFQAVG